MCSKYSVSSLRIGFVYDAVYPWEKGGAQKRIRELATRLAEDHEVHLFGMKYWEGPDRMKKDGIVYHGVCEPYELYTDGRRSIAQAIKFAAALTKPLLRENLDVVDCQQFPYFPVFTSKAHELVRQSELVVTWYEVWDDYWYDYLGPVGLGGKAVERATLKLGNTVIPISDYIADDLAKLGKTENVHVVENGVDYDALQEIPAADADWDIVYVGRLSEHKRVEHLLQAVDIISSRRGSDLNVCIVGDGPERDDLERQARDYGVDDQVEFLGFVEADEDVIANIKAAKMFVLPSIREGFPNTILESNACGVPSIVVDHPENGSTAVVDDGVTGFVVDPTPEAIADRVEEILADPNLQEQLSDGAREYGQAHDWSNIVTELEEVYLNTLN
ncbi:glycosyl transferase family 1 [Halarchaeum grantii]|uniref:Glycosyl transferase family 1 n=1 Tax=Halarchaeum grantii TaxID=1193105 RepID=A0A830FAY4_9EURY|nr:glycosyltransferase family 4 protein [Halarchaeum grantii]GGL36223.1 glycosyl transferase family 1 [Halarchaeum grantii]